MMRSSQKPAAFKAAHRIPRDTVYRAERNRFVCDAEHRGESHGN